MANRHSHGRAAARAFISAVGRKRREDAVNYARSSAGLEGFKLSTAGEQHAPRFINGEIDLPGFVKVRNESPRAEATFG